MVSTTVAVLGIGATGLLLVCSAFFSSAEIAIFSLQPSWIDERAAGGGGAERTLQELRADPHRLLVTLLVGNTLVNIAISSIVTALLVGIVPAGPAVVLATLVVTLLILIFGEIVPKSYGLGNADTWSVTVATPVRWIERALSPLITVLEAVTSVIVAPIRADTEIEKPYLE